MNKTSRLSTFFALMAFAGSGFAYDNPVNAPRTEPAGDFYISARGGVSDLGKFTLNSNNLFGTSEGVARFDTGYHGSLAYGYHFDPASLRIEGEFIYNHIDVKAVDFTSGSDITTGNVQIFSLMMNGIYELIGVGTNAHPYLGFGVGLNHLRPKATGSTKVSRVGYQFIAGLMIHKKDGFAIDLGYRNLFMPGMKGVSGAPSLQMITLGFNFDVDEDLT